MEGVVSILAGTSGPAAASWASSSFRDLALKMFAYTRPWHVPSTRPRPSSKPGPGRERCSCGAVGAVPTPRATCTSPHARRLWSQWRHHSQPPGPGSGTESWLSGLGERETRNGCHYQKEEAEATAVMTSPARGTWAPRTPLSFIPVLRSVGVTQRGGMAMAAQERPEEPRRQKRWCHLRNQSRPHLQGTCKRGNDSIGEPSRSEKPD